MAYTPQADWVTDQVFDYSEMRTLINNRAELWDALHVEHDQYTGIHKGFHFASAVAQLKLTQEDKPITADGDIDQIASLTVTGNGTSWADGNATDPQPGDVITTGGASSIIESVDSATQITTQTALGNVGPSAAQSYSLADSQDDTYYEYAPWSFGVIGTPERLCQGLVRITLAYRCAAMYDRAVFAATDDRAWNDRVATPTDNKWWAALVDSWGDDSGVTNKSYGWLAADEDSIVVKICEENNTYSDRVDHPFGVVVHQYYA